MINIATAASDILELDVGDLIAQYKRGVCCQRISDQEGHVGVGEEYAVVLSLFEGSQELSLDLGLCLLEDHLSFDSCHLQVVLLLLDHLLQVDALHLQVGVGFDHLLPLFGQLLLHSHLFLLRSDEEVHLQLLYLFEVAADAVWNVWLGDSDGKDLDAWCPLGEVLVKRLDEFLVELVEYAYIDLLQGMLGAELIDLMMQLVGDPKLLVVLSIVEHCLVNCLLAQFVDHLHLVEVYQRAIGGAAGNVGDGVSLDADLHLDELFIEGNAEVETRLAESRLQYAQRLVDANITFFNLVEAAQHCDQVRAH